MRELSSFVVIVALAASACSPTPGNGVAATEQRTLVGSVEGIQARSGLTVEVIVDPTSNETRLALDSDENLLPLIYTTLVNGQLEIASENIAPVAPTAVRVTVPSLATLSGSDPGTSLRVEGIDTSDGPFSVYFGQGAVGDIEGNCRDLTVVLADQAELRAFDLVARTGRLQALDQAVAELHVTEALDVVASGSSVVRLRGEAVVSEQLVGGSTLTREP